MNRKWAVYPAVIIGLLLIVGLVLVGLQFSITIEQIPEPEIVPQTRSPDVTSTPTPKPTASLKPDPAKSNPESPRLTSEPGALRMSNQTDQPVRVVLLTQTAGVASRQNNYNAPAHWDFAPQEGSRQGLILSLPTGNLKLKKGDILVAFAQDGSRRYWGPYVVGETAAPVWQAQISEWQLTLQP